MLPTEHFGFATSAAQSEPEIVTTKAGKTSAAHGLWEDFLAKRRRERKPISGENLRRWKSVSAVDFDFRLAKDIGADHFRISINPPRVLDPNGTTHPEGIEFYREVFSAASDTGLKLTLALHHGQGPTGLNWANPRSVSYWTKLTETVIQNFGNRKEFWGIMPHCEALGAPLFTTYMKGGVLSSIVGLQSRNEAIDNMIHFQENAVGLVEKHWGRDKKNKPMIIFAHAWIPARPKHLPFIENHLVQLWQKNWNYEAIKRFISPEIVVGIDTYSLQPMGLSTILTPSEWPVFYRPYKESHPNSSATRVAVEQAHAAFPKNRLAVTEMGFGEPENTDDVKRPIYLRESLEELEILSGKIPLEFIDIWTLVDNMEWVDGDKMRFGVAKSTNGKPVLKKSGKTLQRILHTN